MAYWTKEETENMVKTYGDMLYRICLVMLKNENDAEDAVQDVIMRIL